MLNNWSNLNKLTDFTNDTAKNLSQQRIIGDYCTLDDSSANATPFLRATTNWFQQCVLQQFFGLIYFNTEGI